MSEVEDQFCRAYEEVVHWRKNMYPIPNGCSGKKFLRIKAKLYNAVTENSPLVRIAMTAVATMEHLLLQSPSQKAKRKDLIKCLYRRLKLWEDGDIEELLWARATAASLLRRRRR